MATKITSLLSTTATTNTKNTNLHTSSSSFKNQLINNYTHNNNSNLELDSLKKKQLTVKSSDHIYMQSLNSKTDFSSACLNNKNSILNSIQKLNKNDGTNNYDFKRPFDLNNLVWAKLKNFPWWPCQIVRDLVDKNEYFKTIGNKEMYLVEMIGAYKERAWVSQSSLFKYKGIESFKTYAQDQVDRAETKFEKERLAERFQLKVSLNRRDEWDRAIIQADLIIQQIEENNKLKTSFKRKRYNNNDEINDEFMKIKFSKIDSSNVVDSTILNHSNQLEYADKQEKVDEEDQEDGFDRDENEVYNDNDSDEDEDESTSDDDDSDSYQPTPIYDIEQPIQNIYTNYNSTNINSSNLKNIYSEDEHQHEMHSINSIMTQLENNISKTKHIKNNNQQFNNFIEMNLFYCENNKSTASATSIQQSLDDNATSNLNDLTKKKKRGRKPKQSNDNENNSLKNNNNYFTSTSVSSNSSSNISSNQSSPSNSRKNSADLTYSLNDKKNLGEYAISNETNTMIKNHKKNENSKSKHSFDQSQLNELLLKETKDFDLNLNDFIGLNSSNKIKQDGTSSNAANSSSSSSSSSAAETYLIDRYKYAVRHIRQGLSVEEACNKYRISKGALLKCLSGGTAPRGKKTRLTETEENEIVEWLINNKNVKYNEAIHLVFEQVERIFQQTQRPNPFNNGKPSMDWWYDFLSRHPQIMASKPDWLRRGKVNDQYIRDVQSGQLKCTKFRRALLSAIQYIKSLTDSENAQPSVQNTSLQNEKLILKKESAISNDFFSSANILEPCLKTIKTKSIKINKISLNNNNNNKANGLLTSYSNQQQQLIKTKQRQTMNSISTTIDLPIKQIKKPDYVPTKSWSSLTTDNKTDNLIESTPHLIDYTDEDLASITNILETTTHSKLDTNDVDNQAVRFDDNNFLTNTVHQNLLLTDNLTTNNNNHFTYDTIQQTNDLHSQDSSVYLNGNYNSIHNDNDQHQLQTDDEEFDDNHQTSSSSSYIDPSQFYLKN